jgi:putative hemolysin
MTGSLSYLLPLLVLLVACGATSPPTPAQEDQIREAVFRYQFQHNRSGISIPASAYCLTLGEYRIPYDVTNDPSDEFIRRFEGHVPAVKKGSECYFERRRGQLYTGVIDRETGEPALVFRVESVKWVNNQAVVVEGGYNSNLLSASGNVYELTREEGKWVVEKVTLRWIA